MLDCHARVMTEVVGRRSDCDLGSSGVSFSPRGHSEFPDAVEWFGHPVPVEVVASEAVETTCQLWAGASDQVRVPQSGGGPYVIVHLGLPQNPVYWVYTRHPEEVILFRSRSSYDEGETVCTRDSVDRNFTKWWNCYWIE